MSYEERLEQLAAIKETLMSDRKYYLKLKDWKRVSDITNRLKACAEKVATVHHRYAKDKAALAA